MKLLVALLLLSAGILSSRADILANTSFSDGKAHWKGDAHEVDAASGDGSATSGSPSGVIINLKKDKWSKIFQTFTLRDPKLYYTITFKLSPDYKIAKVSDGQDSEPDMTDVPGLYDGSFAESTWPLILRNSELPYNGSYRYLHPDPSKPSPQTVMGRFGQMPTASEAVIILLIPPGQGTVTLLNFAVSATDPAGEP